jgi:hypothetical protein
MQPSNEPQGNFEIWDATIPAERAAWLALWKTWPNREVFAHPSYGELFTKEHDRFLCASFVIPGRGAVLYPFVQRRISIGDKDSEPLTDLISPYGYGGPYFWGLDASDGVGEIFWSKFDSWAVANRVVTEFLRFDLHSGALLAYPGEKVVRSQNVVVPLDGSWDEIWMRFEHKVRKNVKKAQRGGVTVQVDLDGTFLPEFLELYEGTMDRREAGEGYYFGRAFFEKLNRELPGQFAYFHASLDDRIVSTELVLISARSVYSFLGGTDSAVFAHRPNDLLKYEVMRWAREQGKLDFVLGGGARPGDGIERYKRSFAPDGVVDFTTGQRILLRQLHDNLIAMHKQEVFSSGDVWPEESNFFPMYRVAT